MIGKETLGDLFRSKLRSNEFDINTNSAFAGHRDQGQLIGMREIEVQIASVGLIRQRGLTIWRITETKLVRIFLEIAAEDHAQRAARDGEAIAISFKMKAVGARALVRRELWSQRRHQRIIQSDAPDMDFMFCGDEVARR